MHDLNLRQLLFVSRVAVNDMSHVRQMMLALPFA